MKIQVKTSSVFETQELAKKIAEALTIPSVITLNGDLGAGKTQFAKGVAKALNIKEDVSSPTFNILKCYFSGTKPFYHIDAYRLEDGVNEDIGLEEVIDGDGICVIEWATFIKKYIHESLDVTIEIINEDERLITFETSNAYYKKVFDYLRGINI